MFYSPSLTVNHPLNGNNNQAKWNANSQKVNPGCVKHVIFFGNLVI